MYVLRIFLIFSFLVGTGIAMVWAQQQDAVHRMVDGIHWHGQAAVALQAGKMTIWIDPFELEDGDTADLILITHCHSDHCSPGDIKKVLGPETLVIAPADCADKLQGLKVERFESLAPGQQKKAGEVLVEAVPAYNREKTRFHPKENNWVGYVLTIDGVRVYHFGDTERVEEMKQVECDIALVPLGQIYTMGSVDEAADAVRDVKAKVAIPIHYGRFEGKEADAAQLVEVLGDECEVVIKANE